MKIAVMMRAMDQDSGFRSIVKGYVTGMLRRDARNTYLLLYRTNKWLGEFTDFPNAKEVLLRAPHKLLWDQVAVPLYAWKEKADVIFNPKFSVPLLSHCPVTMGLQEPVWWAWPEHYEWFNVRYMRILLPLYCRKCTHMFPNSQFILEENRKHLRLPFANTTVTYSAAQPQFRPLPQSPELIEWREEQGLPQKLILVVTRVDHPGLEGSKSFHAGKNPETAVRAFGLIRDKVPHDLVVAGRRVLEYFKHVGLTDADLERVHCPGYLSQEDLIRLYNLADVFVIPSLYEGCPSTLLEAMACGRAVVASRTGACPDVGGGAALLADPRDPADFASKILAVLNDSDLMAALMKKSLHRSASFSWDRTAELTLDALTRVVQGDSRPSES